MASATVSLPPLARYGVAIAAAGATVTLLSHRLWLNPDWGAAFGFLVCVPAIMLSGWVGGWGPGTLATLVCATGAYYWLIDPVGTWALTQKRELLGVVLLVAVGAVITALNEAWRRSAAAAARSREELDVTLRRERAAHEAEQAARLAADLAAEHLRRSAEWSSGQKEAFQAAVNGASLEVSLGILMRTAIEQTGGEARCAFYIVDADGTELRHVTGMPGPYDRPVSLKISQEAPGCGLAVIGGQPLIAPDVTLEPRWQKWLSVADEYGFRACWSFPVETTAGKVVGSFAMYFKEPRDTTAADRELAAALTQSAAIIISQHHESQERARIAEELQAAARQKDQFLAMLGHELRNPLFPIGTASELLSRTLPEGGHARFAAEVIKRQSAQLMRLVDDLLDIGRITQGRIQLQRTPLELAEVIAQAVETVEPKLREKRHELSVAGTEASLYVHGDFARLVQCLSNVIANAAKYSPPRGSIRIETRAEGDMAVISVRDNGVGIAPELLPRIFELFVQGDTTLDRAEGGLGIGLSVVKRLIRMHGGEVAAESAGPGQGTRIEMRLPRIARPDESMAPRDGVRAPPRRVLIVEDNADAAHSLAALLDTAGHQTLVASGGRQALEVIDSFQPEVALVDIGLPEINGYELARRFRANLRLRGVRLVAVTGYGQEEDRERARAAGFDEHLVKPVDLAAVERALVDP